MSPFAANKQVIGLVATEGIKELVILFEQTAGKAIVEGDIEQLKPEDKDIFLYKLECFIGISTICEKPCHHTWKTTIIFFSHLFSAMNDRVVDVPVSKMFT